MLVSEHIRMNKTWSLHSNNSFVLIFLFKVVWLGCVDVVFEIPEFSFFELDGFMYSLTYLGLLGMKSTL